MGKVVSLSAVALVALCLCASSVNATTTPPTATTPPVVVRTYFIQAERVLWNYTDLSNINHCTYSNYTSEAALWTQQSESTIGASYYRGLYREYTDSTFTHLRVRSEWAHLGSLGPVIRGAVGDTIRIVFRNALPFPCNLRANADIVTNEKAGSNRAVAPGATRIYLWTFTEESGPGSMDSSSTMWIYRSFIDSTVHDYTGLVGPVIVTRRNMTTGFVEARPKDVDREFVLMFSVIHESANYFLQDNLNAFLGGHMPEDLEHFEESNLKHAINGYLFCHNDELFTMNLGETVRWYVMDIGTEVDLHTPHWHANTVEVLNHHVDEFKMEPGAVTVATMYPDSVGRWMLHCHVNDHITAGMVTTFRVNGATYQPTATPGRIVPYFIAAEEVMWDYLPGGKSKCSSPMVKKPSLSDTLSQVYKKAMYVCYTDSTFTKRCPKDASQEHTGYLGAIMRANVGDILKITFLNRLDHPTSLHAHGVFYNKSSEGSIYQDTVHRNGAVPPGERANYRWFVREEAGPGKNDGSTLMWMYHSHTDEIADTNAGLIGMIIISRYGAKKDYDREFFLSVSSMDESSSLFYEDYLTRNLISEEDQTDEFNAFQMKLSINGYLHCTQPGLTAFTGERVRWYVLSIGTEIDVHSLMWTGQTVTQFNSRQTAVILQPANMHTVDMVVTGCGNFSFFCSVSDHLDQGMMSNFLVTGGSRGCPAPSSTFNKQVFIQAEEYEWDYGSRGKGCEDQWTEHELTYIENGPTRIGGKYIKARFRAYTDATFRTPVGREAYLGSLGPTIRAAVGDRIRVVFRNNLTFPANMVPLGLQYSSEAVAWPGKQVVYFWTATASSGPAVADSSTIAWLYHSTYNKVQAELAGLVGAIVVSHSGAMGFARDVQRELVLSFSIADENGSPFLTRNIRKYTNTTRASAIASLIADPDFQESNLKHAVNGNLFCNLNVQARVGERVRLYLLSVGSSLDMHSITVRDNSLVSSHGALFTRMFAAPAYAGSVHIADVVVDRAGLFLIQCDVHDHHDAGMIARMRVDP